MTQYTGIWRWMQEEWDDIQAFYYMQQKAQEEVKRLDRAIYLLLRSAEESFTRKYEVEKGQTFVINGYSYTWEGLAIHEDRLRVIFVPPDKAEYGALYIAPVNFIRMITKKETP